MHHGGPAHFAWPRVPHPAIAGTAATIAAIRAAVAAAGGPDKVLGFVYELVQERTGCGAAAGLRRGARSAAQRARPAADRGRDDDAHATAAAGARSCRRAIGLVPDVLAWWGGGQTGYLHVATRWFVGTPLTLVSTWDGDELSLVRQHHQLRAARALDIAAASQALDQALAHLPAGVTAAGLGAYRVLSNARQLADTSLERGIAVRRFPGDRLGIIPALDQIERAAAALAEAL